MGRRAKQPTISTEKKMRPAMDPEARLNQLVALAYDAAERQLRENTASSQVITQLLKYGTAKEKMENEKLRKELELITAKTEELRSKKRTEELLSDALTAFRKYSGNDNEEDLP